MLAYKKNFPQNHFLLPLLIHIGFIFTGITTTILGIALPALCGRLMLTDAVCGTLFTVQFTGSLLGTLLSGFLWKRFGFPVVLLIGLTIMSLGVFGLGWLNWNGAMLCIFLNGIGIGLTIPASNLLIAALNPHRPAAALNILNFAWSAGALLSPAFFGLLGTQQNIRLPTGLLSGSLILIAFCFLFASFKPPVLENFEVSSLQAPASKIYRHPFAVLTAVLLFFYVGTENSLSGWLTAFSLRLGAAETTFWTRIAIAFWASFLLGRLAAPFGIKRIKGSVYVLVSLIVVAFGMILLLLTAQIVFVTIGVIFTGFGLAPVFPTLLAEFTQRFKRRATKEANWLFISSTCGGAFLTWTVGFLSGTFGSLRIGFFAIFLYSLLMIVLQTYLTFFVNRVSLADPLQPNRPN